MHGWHGAHSTGHIHILWAWTLERRGGLHRGSIGDVWQGLYLGAVRVMSQTQAGEKRKSATRAMPYNSLILHHSKDCNSCSYDIPPLCQLHWGVYCGSGVSCGEAEWWPIKGNTGPEQMAWFLGQRDKASLRHDSDGCGGTWESGSEGGELGREREEGVKEWNTTETREGGDCWEGWGGGCNKGTREVGESRRGKGHKTKREPVSQGGKRGVGEGEWRRGEGEAQNNEGDRSCWTIPLFGWTKIRGGEVCVCVCACARARACVCMCKACGKKTGLICILGPFC